MPSFLSPKLLCRQSSQMHGLFYLSVNFLAKCILVVKFLHLSQPIKTS
jgi:hypothetical protein